MSSIKLIDLSSYLDTAEFRELLLFLVGWRENDTVNHQIVDHVVQTYRNSLHQYVFGVKEGGRLVGMIGLEINAPKQAVIRHIVVHPAAQGKGIGRTMITEAGNHLRVSKLEAETDREAVEFYKRCGFEVQSLGEKYPNTERFYCVRRLV